MIYRISFFIGQIVAFPIYWLTLISPRFKRWVHRKLAVDDLIA